MTLTIATLQFQWDYFVFDHTLMYVNGITFLESIIRDVDVLHIMLFH